METSYKRMKEEILQYYEELLKIAKEAEVPDADSSMQALYSQAKKIRDDKYYLLVAGEAKSGKSTFINAYLGTEILPMDVRQCTSSIVKIHYGREFCLNAVYADGRKKKVTGEKEIRNFLIMNAALDDDFRDIPVTTINNEIILEYEDKKIPSKVIEGLLEAVSRENIHNLPIGEYNDKIRDYIRKKQPHWREIVVEIDIAYPIEDENMRGVRIIDSPGVNAAGRVGDITADYIQKADAIMFLRPITGQAIEAESFKDFLESASVNRNKNAKFLVLTRRTAVSEEDIEKAYEEFVNMYGARKTDLRRGIPKEQIITVDSKAQLYYNRFQDMSTEEIRAKMRECKKSAEPFLKEAWYDAEDDKEEFLKNLAEYSNFNVIDQSLNRFGRRAMVIALGEFLGRMQRVYEKIVKNQSDIVQNYQLKAKNPRELAKKIEDTQKALNDIQNRMRDVVDKIYAKYVGSDKNGEISQRVELVMKEYTNEIEQIDGLSDTGLDDLEKLTFHYIEIFDEFEDNLQKKMIAECNEKLVTLSNQNMLPFITLEPDFSEEIVQKIKEDMKSEAEETYTYKTGKSHKKKRTGIKFLREKYFILVKNSIKKRMESIKQQVINDLCSFAGHTVAAYKNELAKNENVKRNELNRIKNDKKSADEIREKIVFCETLINKAGMQEVKVKKLKAGIDSYISQ